ncbi:MAG: archaemetzincin family Zn-dependent metalloprotease [Planctomycetota bacterium]|nr:archaemetzincin family Zn-dependent metalloprotease [Planctomycetota bacterium]
MWIEVIPLNNPSRDSLVAVVYAIQDGLGLKTHISPSIDLPKDSYNAARKQYYADSLLLLLSKIRTPSSLRTIGVIDEDLYSENLNYVFGSASQTEKSAVVSLIRFTGNFWGLKEDSQLFLKRARKLVLHELGHTLGLHHCTDPCCVMLFSNTLAELDSSSEHFCPSCAAKLNSFLETSR